MGTRGTAPDADPHDQGEGGRGRERRRQESRSAPAAATGTLVTEEDLSKLEKTTTRTKKNKRKKKKPQLGKRPPARIPPPPPSLPQCREGTGDVWGGKQCAVLPGLPSPLGLWGHGDGHVAHRCWGARPSGPAQQPPSATDFLWPLAFGTSPPQTARGALLASPPSSPAHKLLFHKHSHERHGQS